eukprot:6824201-Pyramimonas_sp.AAC.1
MVVRTRLPNADVAYSAWTTAARWARQRGRVNQALSTRVPKLSEECDGQQRRPERVARILFGAQ